MIRLQVVRRSKRKPSLENFLPFASLELLDKPWRAILALHLAGELGSQSTIDVHGVHVVGIASNVELIIVQGPDTYITRLKTIK